MSLEQQVIYNNHMRGLNNMQRALINTEVARLEMAQAALARGDTVLAEIYLANSMRHMKGWAPE